MFEWSKELMLNNPIHLKLNNWTVSTLFHPTRKIKFKSYAFIHHDYHFIEFVCCLFFYSGCLLPVNSQNLVLFSFVFFRIDKRPKHSRVLIKHRYVDRQQFSIVSILILATSSFLFVEINVIFILSISSFCLPVPETSGEADQLW